MLNAVRNDPFTKHKVQFQNGLLHVITNMINVVSPKKAFIDENIGYGPIVDRLRQIDITDRLSKLIVLYH